MRSSLQREVARPPTWLVDTVALVLGSLGYEAGASISVLLVSLALRSVRAPLSRRFSLDSY